MKALIVTVVLLLAPIRAVGAELGSGSATGASPAASSASQPSWGDGKTSRGSRPIATPATGAPYNVRQMALGAAIMAIMVALLVWLIRRNRIDS